MIKLDLEKIAQITNAKIINFPKPLTIHRISTHSKEQNQQLFLALKGKKFDGHNFIQQAINNGAEALCLSQKIFSQKPILLVKDTLQAYQDIAHHQITNSLALTIGITGSNGKTSLRSILETYLINLFSKEEILSTLDNTNNHIGISANILRLNKKHKFIILEMGSNHYKEIQLLTRIAPLDIAIVTNIGHAHIGHFKNQDQLTDEKLSIFSGLKTKGIAFLAYDIFINNQNSKHLKNKNIITFGSHPKAHINYSYKTSYINYCLGTINQQDIHTSLTGKHQFQNLTIAYAILKKITSINDNQFKKIAKNLFLPPMRMQIIQKQNKTWINDAYNANPESLLTTIKWFQEITQNKSNTYLILADMLELGKDTLKYHKKIADFITSQQLNNQTIIVGKFMAKAFSNNCLAKFHTSLEAKVFCKKNIPENSILLLKGSRKMQLEKIIQDNK